MTAQTNKNIRWVAQSLFCILFFLTVLPVNAQLTKEELSKTINISKLQHPYLFFSNSEKPAILERIKTDKASQKVWEELLAKGHRYVKMPFVKRIIHEPENPRFSTYGEATTYLNEISDGALTLSFLYQMTGNQEYANRAIEFAIALCDVPNWVNAAHRFDIIYPRVWPWNAPDDQVVFSFDIHAAAKATTLSIAYDWLYPALTMHQRDKMRNALLEKAVTRVRGNYEFFWWATTYRCNWTAVCYSGLGLASLTLLKDNPQLVDVIAESYNGVSLTFDEMGEDGGWQEGRGYFGKTVRESLHFMDALKRMSSGKYNLFNHTKLKKYPMDFFLFGLTANFGDSEGYPVGTRNMANKLIEETGNGLGAWYRDKFLREDSDIFDIIWPHSKVTPVEPKQKSRLFKTIDWAIMRSDFFDPSTVTIATKAGLNDDPHHGHLDVGHFILTWHNTPFIRDIGRMAYDEFYFNDDRYDYPHASSLGHNLIHVNGEKQIIAKKKNQPWKDGIGGKILDFRTSDKRDYVLMDPTKAYPGKELKKWRRSIVLEKPAITVVVDEVEANPGAEIEARFFPGVGTGSAMTARDISRTLALSNPSVASSRLSAGSGEYNVLSNYVYLTDTRHNMALIPLVLNNDFKFIEDRLPFIPVTLDARLASIPYFAALTKAKTNTSIIATVILPVKDQKDAEAIVKNTKVSQLNNNEIEVTVSTESGNYKWTFEKKADGYILKD